MILSGRVTPSRRNYSDLHALSYEGQDSLPVEFHSAQPSALRCPEANAS
jgi:hypothetical protein